MRRSMRTALITTAALVAAVAVCCVLSLPAAPLTSSGTPDPTQQVRTLSGAVHVHSTASDGRGTRQQIAAAAARAGLQFVVFTDHGDGTRRPEPAAYISGVLCIDAVEISTDQGHYVALGLGAAPYRLGGAAAAVVEDVRRLGGFGVAAHPDSPKPALAWSDWAARVDGVEWLNADTAVRQASTRRLGAALLGYLFRPGPALAGLLTLPDATLRRWETETRVRVMPALAGHDAHGGLGGSVEGARGVPGVPSYEASFRSFSTRAILAAALTGQADQDAAALLAALRAGRTYTAVQATAAPAWLEFSAERGSARAGMGERLQGGGPATLRVRAATVSGATVALLHDGRAVAQDAGPGLTAVVADPGAYHVEVTLAGRGGGVPWMLSNPIYLDLPPETGSSPAPPAHLVRSLLPSDWRIEHDPTSAGELRLEDAHPVMSYTLGRGGQGSQFVALVAPLTGPPAAYDGVTIDLASSSPLRLSVQMRSVDGSRRWRASVYVPPGGEAHTIATSALQPVEPGNGPFDPAVVGSLLLVIDLVNAVPGGSGRLTVRDIALTSRF
jgi:hypothetical protein